MNAFQRQAMQCNAGMRDLELYAGITALSTRAEQFVHGLVRCRCWMLEMDSGMAGCVDESNGEWMHHLFLQFKKCDQPMAEIWSIPSVHFAVKCQFAARQLARYERIYRLVNSSRFCS
jgi:hypothetical protein